MVLVRQFGLITGMQSVGLVILFLKGELLVLVCILDCKLADVIDNGSWNWPPELSNTFDGLLAISPPCLKVRVIKWYRGPIMAGIKISVFQMCGRILENVVTWFLGLILFGSVSVSRDTLSWCGLRFRAGLRRMILWASGKGMIICSLVL